MATRLHFRSLVRLLQMNSYADWIRRCGGVQKWNCGGGCVSMSRFIYDTEPLTLKDCFYFPHIV